MSIPGSTNPLLLFGDPTGGQYQISRSLRFNSSDSAYLSRTPAVAGNRKTWTWAGWVKRSVLGADQTLFEAANGSLVDNYTLIWLNSSGTLGVLEDHGGSGQYSPNTAAVFRDTSAWYHIVVAVDTTQATSTNRIKIYVNGVLQTLGNSYPLQNIDTYVNSTNTHRIGCRVDNSAALSGYLADIYFIDGQALTPSSFTEVSATTGQLIPKTYTGTYGTNGFWLKFSDNSAATAATLGADTSGNGNNWTPNNFSVIQGTGNYVGGTYSANWSPGFTSAYLAFDNDLSTVPSYSSPNVGAGTYTYDYTLPTSISGVTLVEVYADTTMASQISVSSPRFNGSTVILPQSAVSWKTIYSGSSTTFTSFGWQLTHTRSLLGIGFQVYGVRINGSILIDYLTGAGNDSLVDTPTSYGTDTGAGGEVRGNYATLNPLLNPSGDTFSNGNLEVVTNSANYGTHTSTIATPLNGKWYAEITQASANPYTVVGLVASNSNFTATSWIGALNGVSYLGVNGNKYIDAVSSSYGATFGNGDVIGIAYDANNSTVTFYKNGTSQGTISSVPLRTYYFGATDFDTTSTTYIWNFGQRQWAYAPPSGYKALCDTNLGTPVVAKPNTVMDVVTYTGNGSTQSIAGLAFSPDLVWIKARNTSSYNHFLLDTIRGVNNELNSNTTDFEYTRPAPGSLTAFNSDGFNLNTAIGVNANSTTYVGWAWDAGTSTVSNTSGSITSQVRANASAGFSIVTYTGNGSTSQTVGHGLGVNPKLIIVKSRSNGAWNWGVYHQSLSGSTPLLSLNTANAANNIYDAFNPASNSSTVFGIGNEVTTNQSSGTYVAYCFAPVVGYSSFGSYTGNGSTDGPFVYTGFRPRWLLFKRASDGANSWVMLDAARNTYNVVNNELFANLSIAEGVFTWVDFLSNGFKLRSTDGAGNFSGSTYIYAAFAENPFQYARAR